MILTVIFKEQPGMYMDALCLFRSRKWVKLFLLLKFSPQRYPKSVWILNLEFLWKIIIKEKINTLYRGMKDI